MTSKTLVATTLWLAAGAPSSEPPIAEPPGTAADATDQDTCGAARYRELVGSNVAESPLSESADARIVAPDSIVTQDFRPDRLNVIVDADGRITSLECY